MEKRKVELLAPAGNYDSFIGAVNAGADAVYVGGEKFSARAYADNFDTEQLCACIRYAHLFGRRVYLTLNTLIKEKEFSEVYEYVEPFYKAGIDGVIVQDWGVLRFLRTHFPHMELHASTQMAVTGAEFVALCKELGISRVVPARELSLKELAEIRAAGIEVECFVHGAMCYCYSGMCLMSSILGGRSGNRGKCAQPCRLPYKVSAEEITPKDTYTLSLKDMCTIEHIPALIEAGMDSFKIEGRMKRSEYAAGVTALYRKYIDQYYRESKIKVSDADKHILEKMYMRSELQDGYLYKHNGKEMVTADASSYSGLEEELLCDIRRKYLGYTKKLGVTMYARFKVGQESELTLCTASGSSVTVKGSIVEAAQKAAATEESLLKQLGKLGGTFFTLEQTEISVEGACFVPNGMLNALRREAIEQLEQAIILAYFPELSLRETVDETEHITMFKENVSDKENTCRNECVFDKENVGRKERAFKKENGLTLLLKSAEQYHAAASHPIWAKADVLYLETEAMEVYLEEHGRIGDSVQIVYVLPYILRQKDIQKTAQQLDQLKHHGLRYVLVRNVEELALVTKRYAGVFQICTDASVYCWNLQAKEALQEYAAQITLPFELNSKELRPLRGENTEQVIYGYIPLMLTANCIFKTNASCLKKQDSVRHTAYLKDRYGKLFTACTDCEYCYNIIYNSVPLSLHKKYNRKAEGYFRLQFSKETAQETLQILEYYDKWINGEACEFPVEEYTTAHENRQVE